MSESDSPNGSTGAILVRLRHHDQQLDRIVADLDAIKKMHMRHPLCEAPGLCVTLSKRIEHAERALESIRRLVWIGVGMLTLAAVGMPILLEVLRN